MTQVPALAFGLRDRGVIAPGYHADIVVFDPQSIACGPLHSRADLPGGAERLYADAIGELRLSIPVHAGESLKIGLLKRLMKDAGIAESDL